MDEIEIVNRDFLLDKHLFYEKIRMEQGLNSAIPIDRILEMAKDIPKPKSLYGVLKAEVIDENYFSLEDIVISSKKVVKMIKKFNYIIPNIVTAGVEIEEYCLSMTNLLDQYIIMELSNFSLDYAQEMMKRDLESRYNIAIESCIYPGEEGFLLDSGKNIVRLFTDVKEKIGVTITETGLPSPSRTAYSLCFGN